MKFLFLTLSEFSKFPSYKRAVGTGEALALLGHEVAISVMDCEENRLRMLQEAPHCKALWFKRTNPVGEAMSKLRAIRQYRPDVVYSTSFSIRNLAFMRFLIPWGIKTVIEFCELYSEYPRQRMSWKLRETIALFENNYILCASKFLENHFAMEMKKWHLRRHLMYSPYAYPAYLHPVKNDGLTVPTIVFMASLWKGYGVYDVVEAALRLLPDMPNLQLEILGGGPEKENLQTLVEGRGIGHNVHIRGFVAEHQLNDYFSQASVFVSPMHDTLQDRARCPSKLFYYLPYGKPIVTCKIGDPYETLGDYGYYYKCDDIEDMTRTIARAIKESFEKSYPASLINKHSWIARAKQFVEYVQ